MDHVVEAERLADFLNTEDLRRPDRREPPFAPDDLVATPDALSRWLDLHGLGDGGSATDDDLELARGLRRGLRSMLSHGDGFQRSVDQVNLFIRDLSLAVEFDRGGRPHPVPAAVGVRSSLGRLLVDVLRLGDSGEWPRLKTCAAADCRWVFVDHSRPGTGRWCSARACGNRDKTRRYQARRRSSSGPVAG